jgi:hypothetical protein
MRASSATWLASCGIAVSLLLSARADAYCRTSSCNGQTTGTQCEPPRATDCGVELSWRSPCLTYSLQQDASKRASLDLAGDVLDQAFATWMSAACPGGGSPRIRITRGANVGCREQEYNQEQGNANAIIFRDEGWPYPNGASTLALTTVTYNLDTGEIYDADIEVNSRDVDFTSGDEGVVFDLRSILTHEAGHFLGLSHSVDQSATMFADYKQESVNLRDLEADDIAAICATYPAGEAIPATCDSTPRHGFSGACAEAVAAEEQGCCTVAAGAGGGRSRPAAVVLGLALALATGARRRLRRRPAASGTPRGSHDPQGVP